jgi:uncharacterized protein (DUF2141 family)
VSRFAHVLSLLAATTLLAQQPARDITPVAPNPTGTAVVAGLVVEADPEARPVRRAIVTLTGTELPRGRTAITDDAGRFAFENLPAGRFMAAVTKAAYLAGAYGATRPGRSGIPLQIADGQRVTNVRIALARGATLSGTLREMAGEPAANVTIVAFRVPPPGSIQTLIAAATGTTDDRGVYRIYGLMPGTYVVASAMRLSGSNSDISVMPTAEVDRVLRELQQRSGVATSAPVPVSAQELVPPGSYAFAPAFYPGVPSASAAATIKVGLGEERSGIDFPIQYTRTTTIQGTLRSPDGTVPSVQFAINTMGLRLQSLLGSTPTFTTEKGSSSRAFKYTNVTPGRYAISIRTADAPLLWARAEVDVTGQDIPDVNLVLQPAIRLGGRVVFDGQVAPPSTLSVTLTAANGAGGGASGTTQLGNIYVYPAPIGDNGSFELAGIVPDSYRISTSLPASSSWLLRSAVVNGRDVLDYPFEVAANISGAVLTFTDKHTQLSGTLTTTANAVAPGYFIAVFPADRALWRWQSRRITSARTGTDGRWIVKDLPPGDYLVAALSDLDPEDLLDAAILETLVPSAVRVSLRDGEQRSQDLKIGG